MDNFSNTLSVTKHTVTSQKGICVSQHKCASQVGVDILSSGGNAVDVSVAMSFALGVLEPWMSGIGGGGFMLVKNKDCPTKVVEYGMRSPKKINFSDYQISGEGTSEDLFGWPKLKNLHNEVGGGAIAVPGQVAGMYTAHKHYGTIPWAELLQPAITLAKKGIEIDWYAQLIISGVVDKLHTFESTKENFLKPSGAPLGSSWVASVPTRQKFLSLADTLERIAHKGANVFYTGDIAQDIVTTVKKYGGYISRDDLQSYKAHIVDALRFKYKGAIFNAPPRYAAGHALKQAFEYLAAEHIQKPHISDTTYCKYVDAIYNSYQHRLQYESPQQDSCTTHFNVVDQNGNMVSNTQTLVSVFGSGVTTHTSGFLLNNGLMWFDPSPNKPNSLAQDTMCLANMCPTIIEKGDHIFALGAAGGRKIFPAILQLGSFIVDFDMHIANAIHQPRINCTGTKQVLIDNTLSTTKIMEKLKHKGYTPHFKRRLPYPYDFACPSAISLHKQQKQGITEPLCVWGDAVEQK